MLLPRMAGANRAGTLRVGWFSVAPHPFIDAFRRGMAELGWVEGRNFAIALHYANGNRDRLPGMAAGFTAATYDVVVASGSDAVDAARGISGVPVVGISTSVVPDNNLARPAGNLTGIALLFDEVAAKWPELLVEAFPGTKRIGVVFDGSSSNRRQEAAIRATIDKLGRQSVALRIQSLGDLPSAIDGAPAAGIDSLVFASSPLFTANAAQVSGLVRRVGLPAIYESRVLVEHEGLISYGPDLNEAFRRAASYVDRIARGARPADLPIEQPTKFELVVSLKNARMSGFTMSESLLARADEVIE